jgi:hypothetical protein
MSHPFQVDDSGAIDSLRQLHNALTTRLILTRSTTAAKPASSPGDLVTPGAATRYWATDASPLPTVAAYVNCAPAYPSQLISVFNTASGTACTITLLPSLPLPLYPFQDHGRPYRPVESNDAALKIPVESS